jgi:PadR family transcriptional regulator
MPPVPPAQPAPDRADLLQGTLEMLVLKTLALEPLHGWGIAHRIQSMSKDVFLVTQGSLYPALIRMKRRGWVKTSWRVTENNRRARYYELTAAGHRQLDTEHSTWQRASSAINLIMSATLAPEGA